GRPHRPFQGDREPRRAVGAGPDVRHHRPPDVLAAALRGPADRPRDVREEFTAPPRRRDPHADAGHPREQGLPGAGRRGPAAVVGPVLPRRRDQVPLLPRREPLDPDSRPRTDLVRDRLRLPGPARPRPAMAAPPPPLAHPAPAPAPRALRSPEPSAHPSLSLSLHSDLSVPRASSSPQAADVTI